MFIMPTRYNVDDLSHAGHSFDKIVKLADERDMTVDQYLDDVAQRREELEHDLYAYRQMIGDCADDGECD